MKTKTLYIIIFILAAVILIVAVYDRGNIPEINQPQVKKNKEVAAPLETATVNNRPISYNPAVTVIKVPKKTNRVVFKPVNATTSQNAQLPTARYNQNYPVASAGNADTQESAGVTILKKYPTKEEIREMNSRGIVIY